MTRRGLTVVLGSILTVSSFALAPAYTGGPQLIEVLGWQPSTSRVYFRTIRHDESATFGAVYYFDLQSPQPERRHRVSWSRADAFVRDSTQLRQLVALRSRLRPLQPEIAAALPSSVLSIASDTLTNRFGPVPRFRVKVAFDNGLRVEAVTYQHPDLCAKVVYGIAGRGEQVWVLSLRGEPNDPAETDVAVLIPAKFDTTSVGVRYERDGSP